MTLKRITPGLDETTLITTVRRNYADIDLPYYPKRGTVFEDGQRRGDIFKRTDVKAIDQSIQNILLTNHYEKPFNPFFGANLRRLLFELNTLISQDEVEETIRQAIERDEPRVEVISVELYDGGADKEIPKGAPNIFFYAAKGDSERYSLIIYVHCKILAIGEEITTTVNMSRLR